MKINQYIKLQELISSAQSKEDLVKIGKVLQLIPTDADKQGLAEMFGNKWVGF